ncbi:uncharacterized protein [Argopecten irradians]|uniref:uncharacterized protein n=1 Tax=Argopecten irradians TaxID=31199 RepID=UPI003710A817
MADLKENVDPKVIDKMTVHQLKNFLRSYGQPVGGRSEQLKERAKGVLRLGLPSKQSVREGDEEDYSQRSARQFVSPLGEILTHPLSLSNWSDDVTLLPDVSQKDLLNYLVLNRSRTFDNLPLGAVKQLKAKVFYDDCHIHSIKYHFINEQCSHCYVACKVVPSMPTADVNKRPDYDVWISLSKMTGQIHAADCSCPAGNGESCNHIAGLLYALVDITDKKASGDLAATSKPCKWNQPRKRKLSPQKAEQFKNTLDDSSYVDYRPAGKQSSIDRQEFCKKLSVISPNSGYLKLFPKPEIPADILKQCCLPEPDFCFCDHIDLESDSCKIVFESYVANLKFDASQIAHLTKGQSSNPIWKKARSGRLTASMFGAIARRNSEKRPVSLIKSCCKYYGESFTDAQELGCTHETKAKNSYLKFQSSNGHRGISIDESGLCVMEEYPYIGASPDGFVTYETCTGQGLVEVKCPFKYRDITPQVAATHNDFCCHVDEAKGTIQLKRSHPYYYQVQGQMAVTDCMWCDFVVWTPKGISVERIHFDNDFWNLQILPKLQSFFRKFIVPEMYSRRIFRNML